MKRLLAALALLLAATTSCGHGPTGKPALSSAPVTTPTAAVPRPEHVVVVVMENHSYGQILGNHDAPYFTTLAARGATFTQSYGNYHPSQPNYLILFSGSTQGVTSDSCGHTFSTPNLATALRARGLSFVGYSEGLPHVGDTVCSAGAYARKHNPWSDFSNVPAADNCPFRDFPSDYSKLPAVSFVVPNLDHDMHDGSVATADGWLREHLGGYVSWARTRRSLLVLTWDEDDNSPSNHILTVIAGARIVPGRYAEHVDHYRVLRTLEAAYGLTPVGDSARAAPITDVWAR